MANKIFILFNGKKYYRNPKTGYYENKSFSDGKRKTIRLHRVVYEFYSGKEIPKGYHIHHKDENKDNNDFSNLALVSQSEHAKIHSKRASEIWKRPEMQEASKRGREKTKIWHASKEGREWHSKHQKEYIAKLHITKICPDCGRRFNTPNDHREQTICRWCRDKYLKRELRRKAKEKGL